MSGMNKLFGLIAKATVEAVQKSVRDRDARIAERIDDFRSFDARVAEALAGLSAGRPSPGSARSGGEAGAPPPTGFGRRSDRVGPPRIAEDVTVVLRRQVPIRHAEPPRSWIGGLPVMPDGVDWPRGVNSEKPKKGPVPLHFVAQIACADLPPELWNGLGPRDGWMLFFVNNNMSSIEDGDAQRVIHVETWGCERQPPADIGPVHDGVYTGSQFTSYMDQADVPVVWRRWPVDLAVFPNRLHHDGPRSFGTPPDFATTLYAGLPVGGERDRAPTIGPFSWRCLGSVRKQMDAAASTSPAIHPNEERIREKLVAQGSLTKVLDLLDADEAKYAEGAAGRLLMLDPATIEEEQRPQWERARAYRQRRLDRRADVAALIAQYPDHDAMLTFLETERVRRARWRASVAERLAELNAAIDATDPDTPLLPDRWIEIRSELESDSFTGWSLAYLGGLDVILEKKTETSWERFGARVLSAAPEIAADCYVNPARRHLVPDDAVALLEPWWRTLYNNRPHRMGGYHDGVQSDAVQGPTDAPLLLQLATDDAMQWCWGDAGALYWFVPTTALASGAVDKAECHEECH